MAGLPLKHSVLVTQPMSDAGMTRLRTFFQVETRIGGDVPSRDELADWLHGKAGVIADSRFVFDTQLVDRLPTLKAICNLDAAHHNLDLQALTNAGIRATHTPEPDLAWCAAQARAENAWHAIKPLLERAVVPVPEAGKETGRYGTWSRKVVLGPALQATRMGIFSEPRFAKALMTLAQAALVTVCADRETALSTADVLVVEGAPAHGLSAADRARIKSTACVWTLAADIALMPDVRDQPWALRRSDMAAESLVASLGFGRNSWHPQYLLNPDIACNSCC